jgi:hypothetical protein
MPGGRITTVARRSSDTAKRFDQWIQEREREEKRDLKIMYSLVTVSNTVQQ